MPVAGVVDLLGAETLESIGCAIQANGLALRVSGAALPYDAPLALANDPARMIGRRDCSHVGTQLYLMLSKLNGWRAITSFLFGLEPPVLESKASPLWAARSIAKRGI